MFLKTEKENLKDAGSWLREKDSGPFDKTGGSSPEIGISLMDKKVGFRFRGGTSTAGKKRTVGAL